MSEKDINSKPYLLGRDDINRLVIVDMASGDMKGIERLLVCDYSNSGSLLKEKFGFDSSHKIGSKKYQEDVIRFIKTTTLSEADFRSRLFNDLSSTRNPNVIYGILERSTFLDVSDVSNSGLLCVYGGSGSGKTTFLNELERKAASEGAGYHLIMSSEPVASSLPLVPGLAYLIVSIVSGKDVKCIAFDSFRAIVYGSGGSTLSGGVSAAMLEITMNISRLAAACGKLVLGVINPLNVDKEKNATLVEALLGSTSGLIEFNKDERTVVKVSHRYMADREFKVCTKDAAISALLNGMLPCNDSLTSESAKTMTINNINIAKSSARINDDIRDQFNIVKTSNDDDLPSIKF